MELQDNVTFNGTVMLTKVVAQALLGSLPENLVDDATKAQLTRIRDEAETKGGKSYMTVALGSKFRVSVNVYIDDNFAETFTDEAGDAYVKVKTKACVNWPAFGDKSPDDALEFSKIVDAASALAAKVEEQCKVIVAWDLYESKAAREAREEKQQQERERIKTFITERCLGMRDGKSRVVSCGEPHGIPLGTYTATLHVNGGPRLFSLTVTNAVSVKITRHA